MLTPLAILGLQKIKGHDKYTVFLRGLCYPGGSIGRCESAPSDLKNGILQWVASPMISSQEAPEVATGPIIVGLNLPWPISPIDYSIRSICCCLS